jgi:hypothetical protein
MNEPGPRFEVLPGLPPYGPLALPFPASGESNHHEGFVVRFFPTESESWVGNFQPGLTRFSEALAHPDGRHVVVISGGQAYIVDPQRRESAMELGGCHFVSTLQPGDLLVLVSPIDLTALGPEGPLWRTQRISYDGLRALAVNDEILRGEAWSPRGVDDTWVPFEVNLKTGAVAGGSYDGPDA